MFLERYVVMMVNMTSPSDVGYVTVGCSPARQTSYVLAAVSFED